LALAVILRIGLLGIKNQTVCPPSVDQNIFDMDVNAREEAGIESLPGTLREALRELRHDKDIQEALGPHIYSRFMHAKRTEWDNYRARVHQWEIDEYLATF
jgi:glutamine synthetase